MDNENEYRKVLKYFKKTLDDLTIREFIKESVEKYDENGIYIIYDDGAVEVYNEEILELNKSFKNIKHFTISKPVRL